MSSPKRNHFFPLAVATKQTAWHDVRPMATRVSNASARWEVAPLSGITTVASDGQTPHTCLYLGKCENKCMLIQLSYVDDMIISICSSLFIYWHRKEAGSTRRIGARRGDRWKVKCENKCIIDPNSSYVDDMNISYCSFLFVFWHGRESGSTRRI